MPFFLYCNDRQFSPMGLLTPLIQGPPLFGWGGFKIMQPLRDRWLKKALATIPGSSLKGKPGSLIILALAYVEEKPTAQ